MNYALVSSLLKRPWAIDIRYAEAQGFFVHNLLSGIEMDPDVEKDPVCFLVKAGTVNMDQVDNFQDAPEGSIAIINLTGSLMKSDNWCTYGMATIGGLIKEADASPNITAIILVVDSPGGTVDGTQSLADVVDNTTKPIITFIDGLMASAALWIGTQSDYVIAENTTTEIGSIGVMISFNDMRPYWEKMGVKFHMINADQSKDKNKTYTDALKGDYKGMINEILNPLADQFISAVKECRPATASAKENVFSGKMYLAEDALKYGLIDEIGSFERAIEKATELALHPGDTTDDTENQSKTNLSNIDSSTQNKGVAGPTGSAAPLDNTEAITEINSPLTKIKITIMNLPLLCALLGVASLEKSDEGVYLSEDQLNKIEAAIKKANDDAATQLKAEEDLAAANLKITELDTAIASLKKKPAVETGKILQKVDGETTSTLATSDQNDFMGNMNAVAEKYL